MIKKELRKNEKSFFRSIFYLANNLPKCFFTFSKLHSVSMKSNIVSTNNTINITVINGIGTKPTK